MNICVLDDKDFVTECVEDLINDSCQNLKISKPNIFSFTTPEDFFTWLNKGLFIDVCFLDINLESKINGLDIAKKIKEINYHTLLVFMTTYDSYFTEMVQVEPFRFLPKPFIFEDFYSVFVDIYKRIILKNSEHDCLYKFKNNGITYLVNLNEITHISSYKRKILLFDENGHQLEFYGKLDKVESEVKSLTNKFVRISKSYLFNSDYIENIGKNAIFVKGIQYKISPKYKNNIEFIT